MEYISKKSGKTYYLHTKVVNLSGSHEQRIYYFSSTITKAYRLDKMPAGYEIFENNHTGLPMLRKIKKDIAK